MIQEVALFGMGFAAASGLRLLKVIAVSASMREKILKDTANAEKNQKEFNENGGNSKLFNKQIIDVSALGQHLGAQKILNKFNFIIW